ncbi:MAG: hypothetical protein ACLQIB_30505 [Isosphaeraceae bacterium]
MTAQVRTFKRVAAQVAQRMNFKMSAFNRERGLGDFLLDQGANADPIDVAGRAILYFCVDEGGYNGFEVGVMVCVTFLDEVMPSPPTGAARAQALKDLSALMKSSPTLESVKRWVESHYL